MEFNYVCAMIQGCLRSLEKSFTVKLVDIDRDHVDEIDKIVQNLQSLAKGIGLDHEETRKAHLLLLLNTKWDHIAYFEEEKNFCHILNVLPQMSPYLYFKLVSNLGWHAHLGEVILHFPEFLVREILTSLEADLKVLDSKSAVPFIYCLLSNIFHKIMYLQENCKEKVTEFVKLFTAISKFNFDDIINEMDCSTEAKQQYRGYVYRMLIELVRFCIEKIKKWNVPDDDLYAHSCNYDYAVWPQVTYSSCRGKLCLGIIANKCLAVSEEVTIDTYMSWMEVSIMEDSVEKTLQMCVRESAYKTRQAITSAAELHNAVAGTAALEKRLVAIELKPVTEEDEIAQADTDTILMNLCNPKKTQAKWLRGLINRGIFESAPHMKVVSENARLVDAETMIILLDSAVKFLTNHDIPEEELSIIRKTLKTCLRAQSSEGQLEVLSQFVKRFGLITPLLSETFIQRTTLLFNKLIDDDENKDDIYTEMVWLALEDCESLVKRAFNESLAFCHKAPLILDLVKYIAPSVDIVTPHTNLSLYLGHVLTLMHSIKVSRTNKSIEDFLHLLDLSCGMKILSAESLLFGHVMPSLEPAVSSSRTDDILFYLKIVYVLEPYCEPKTVLYIALLIKILNRCRPRIKDFSSNQVEISTMCIELLQHVMSAIERNEMSNDIKWLKSLAEKSPPLTALHLRPVLCPGTTDEPFQEDKSLFWSWRGLGHGNVLTLLQPYERSTLVTSTLKILPSLTMKEWELIGGGLLSDFEQTLFTFGVLVDSLLVLLQVPAMMENLPCFGHIITNFIHYTEAILMPKMKTKRGLKSIEEVKLKIQLLGSVLPEELESSKRPLLQHLEQRLEDVKTPKKTKKDAAASDRSDVIMEA